MRHLFKGREILSAMLASYHNLAFMHRMMTEAREAIAADRFGAYKAVFLRRFSA
ncbi:hypothetical protein [Treponema endosymbiont of Eucomonympha sp.]|uniref:hypothetical protein n=1 Tax=Treponema endosymbiont of Eucomonympha sp. TaxID=1580831 RepID=UPI001E50BB6E|nr:hypothetical protein [Treponema endosymbiont of Eucomonympha sp.]